MIRRVSKLALKKLKPINLTQKMNFTKQIQPPSNFFQKNKKFIRFYGKEVTINVPAMGDSITEGKLAEWCKAENEGLLADDIIAKIETDKVVVDIRAPEKGTLLKYLAAKNEDVKVNQPLFIYSTDFKEGAVKKEEKKRRKKGSETRRKEGNKTRSKTTNSC